MSSQDLVEKVRRSVDERSQTLSLDDLRAAAAQAGPVRSLGEALSHDELAFIVEVHAGQVDRATVGSLAESVRAAGASAISVVADDLDPQSALDDVRAIRQVSELCVVVRHLVVHPLQVCELRIAGADAVMMPMFAFGDEFRDDFEAVLQQADSLSMDAVPSIQDDAELARAVEFEAEIVNIDNREESGEVNVERTFELLADVPVGTTVISESIASPQEVARLHRAGVDALLIDEHPDSDLAAVLASLASSTLDR